MPPSGAEKPDIYVVGMAPGAVEDVQDRQFVGASGTFLRKALEQCGIDLDSVRFYNAVNCIPPQNKVLPQELHICSKRVRGDICAVAPKVVLALGTEAVSALFPNAPGLNITSMRGLQVPFRISSSHIVPVICTWHPSYMLRMQADESSSMGRAWYRDLRALKKPAEVSRFAFVPPTEIVQCLKFPQVKDCFDRLKDSACVAFDVETQGLKPYRKTGEAKPPDLYSIAFAFEDGKAYSLPVDGYWPDAERDAIREALVKWFFEVGADQVKVAHNAKFDLLWMVVKAMQWRKLEEPPEVVGLYQDTLILSSLCDERAGTGKLKVAAWSRFGSKDWSLNMAMSAKHRPRWEDLLTYNAADAYFTLRLWQDFEDRFSDPDMQRLRQLYDRILIPASLQFIRMECRGIPVDVALQKSMQERLAVGLDRLVEEIRKHAKDPYLNPASTKQLQKYFATSGYQLSRKTKGGYSVDTQSLALVVEEHDDPVASKVLEFREASKMQSTYVKGLSKHIYADGRLHGSFSLTDTVTGRTSSSDPNMQNFPKRKRGDIRRLLTAPPGYKICCFDYGQIEARVLGILTGDPEFCEALRKNYDIHLDNSKIVFGEERAKEMRSPVKNGTFAMLYGGGDRRVAESMKCSVAQVEKLRKTVFSRFKEFRPWQESIIKLERDEGALETLFGRRRRSPVEYNQILNFLPQSSASDFCLSVLSVLGSKYPAVLMVHDDLTFFLRDDENLPDAVMDIVRAMLTVPWLFISGSPLKRAWVPLAVEVTVGDSWGSQQPVLSLDSLGAGFDGDEACRQYASRLMGPQEPRDFQ